MAATVAVAPATATVLDIAAVSNSECALISNKRRFVAAIDQGTSSTRVIMYELPHMAVVASYQVEMKQFFSNDGWCEHDPIKIIEDVRYCMEKCQQLAGIEDISSIAGIGITNQRETTVLWDRTTGIPLYNAIVWNDARTKQLVQRLTERHGADCLRPETGLPLSTYFSGLKVRWMIDNIPAVQQAVDLGGALFGTIDTWLIWNLTGGCHNGVHVTDVSNASRTMLLDIRTRQWSQRASSLLGVPLSIMPRVVSSAELYGYVSDSNPWAGVPITACLGDQQAALVGQLCFNAGEAKNTFGTGCFMLLNTGTELVQSRHGLLTTIAFQFGKDAPIYYALEGSIAVAGSAVQWLRDRMHLINSASEIDVLASQVPDNGGTYLVPAFGGLLSPHWHSEARGVWIGLTNNTSRAHLARAVLEASAWQTREVLLAMVADSNVALRSLRIDGGLCNSQIMTNFLADAIQTQVVKPNHIEATANGAAYAAGLALKVWASPSELQATILKASAPVVFKPSRPAAEIDAMFSQWQKAVRSTFGWMPSTTTSSNAANAAKFSAFTAINVKHDDKSSCLMAYKACNTAAHFSRLLQLGMTFAAGLTIGWSISRLCKTAK